MRFHGLGVFVVVTNSSSVSVSNAKSLCEEHFELRVKQSDQVVCWKGFLECVPYPKLRPKVTVISFSEEFSIVWNFPAGVFLLLRLTGLEQGTLAEAHNLNQHEFTLLQCVGSNCLPLTSAGEVFGMRLGSGGLQKVGFIPP